MVDSSVEAALIGFAAVLTAQGIAGVVAGIKITANLGSRVGILEQQVEKKLDSEHCMVCKKLSDDKIDKFVLSDVARANITEKLAAEVTRRIDGKLNDLKASVDILLNKAMK